MITSDAGGTGFFADATDGSTADRSPILSANDVKNLDIKRKKKIKT